MMFQDLDSWWFETQCSGGRMRAVGRSWLAVAKDSRYKKHKDEDELNSEKYILIGLLKLIHSIKLMVGPKICILVFPLSWVQSIETSTLRPPKIASKL